jgi:hypothetical protein
LSFFVVLQAQENDNEHRNYSSSLCYGPVVKKKMTMVPFLFIFIFGCEKNDDNIVIVSSSPSYVILQTRENDDE